METTLYQIATVAFILLTASLFVYVLITLKKSFQSIVPADQAMKWLKISAAILGGWLLFLAVLALSGFFQNFQALPPRFALALLPPVLGIIIISNIKGTNTILAALPESSLISFQTFRIVMELILWVLYLAYIIPVQMTFEGMNFDVLVGLTAPVISYLCFKKKKWPISVAIFWNFLGLTLLATIVSIAILSAPTPFRQFMTDPAPTFIASVPYYGYRVLWFQWLCMDMCCPLNNCG
ncbi:hypothetical protein BH23BAC1_BH23BAC1_06470 [soil metagenome]